MNEKIKVSGSILFDSNLQEEDYLVCIDILPFTTPL
jgi:hypothetical protein